MPKITAEVPEGLYKFLRGHIVDQRLAGAHVTVSTIVTDLLSKWKKERFNLLDAEDSKAVEEKDQTKANTASSMDDAEKAYSFDPTGEEIKYMILSARLTPEEAKQVAASLIRITQELLELAECAKQSKR